MTSIYIHGMKHVFFVSCQLQTDEREMQFKLEIDMVERMQREHNSEKRNFVRDKIPQKLEAAYVMSFSLYPNFYAEIE